MRIKNVSQETQSATLFTSPHVTVTLEPGESTRDLNPFVFTSPEAQEKLNSGVFEIVSDAVAPVAPVVPAPSLDVKPETGEDDTVEEAPKAAEPKPAKATPVKAKSAPSKVTPKKGKK